MQCCINKTFPSNLNYSLSLCVGGFEKMNGSIFSLSRMWALASLVAHTPLTWQGSPGKVGSEAGPAATLSLSLALTSANLVSSSSRVNNVSSSSLTFRSQAMKNKVAQSDKIRGNQAILKKSCLYFLALLVKQSKVFILYTSEKLTFSEICRILPPVSGSGGARL